eukprot:4246586-Prymnesium_polylepis.1
MGSRPGACSARSKAALSEVFHVRGDLASRLVLSGSQPSPGRCSLREPASTLKGHRKGCCLPATGVHPCVGTLLGAELAVGPALAPLATSSQHWCEIVTTVE